MTLASKSFGLVFDKETSPCENRRGLFSFTVFEKLRGAFLRWILTLLMLLTNGFFGN